MTACQELIQVAGGTTNPYLDRWREQGGRVVGYTCTYVPEEVIHAAGLLPYRLRGTGASGTTRADVFLPKFHCSFSRTLFDQALAGAFSFLDGVVFVNACDQLRRMYDVWNKKVSFPFQTIMVMPHSVDEEDFEWFLEHEVRKLCRDLEAHYGITISDDALHQAAGVYNQTRALLDRLYQLRMAANPRLRGVEAHQLVVAATAMPKQDYNRMLAEALDEIEAREPIPGDSYRARILVGGSIIDDPDLLQVIEEAGGLVVNDTLCTGSRWFRGLVEMQSGDPLRAIARRYYDHTPCPRMVMAYERKWQYARQQAADADVNGAIFSLITFCDHHSADNVLMRDDFEAEGVPTLLLNREYSISDMGRFKTRVEAFFEKIGL
jgi:bzd-type benzoyl-CoA reductase N subunit